MYLACCVTLYRNGQILGAHSAAVVCNPHKADATAHYFDGNTVSSRIYGVLNKLLDNRGRSVNYLSGGYQVGYIKAQHIDFSHNYSLLFLFQLLLKPEQEVHCLKRRKRVDVNGTQVINYLFIYTIFKRNRVGVSFPFFFFTFRL